MNSRRRVNSDVGRLSLFMKTILTLHVIALLVSCSPTGRPVPVVLNSSTQAATDKGLPPMTYEQMLPHVARLSKEAGIPNLKDVKLSEAQTELRLWRGLGLVFPRCFVLKIVDGNPAASFLSVKVIGNKGVFRKGKPVYMNTPLNEPHSGWANLLGYLKENGIDSSITLAVDKRYEPYPDAESLILEMKTGSRHTLVHYIDSTASDDGKTGFAICEKIRNEFDLQLTCKS